MGQLLCCGASRSCPLQTSFSILQSAGRACSPRQAARSQANRIALIPPPDHHAEALASHPEAVPSSQRPGRRDQQLLAGIKRPRRQTDGASSDSDVEPPRRPRQAASPATEAGPSATTSLFSPAISISGGKAAAELPSRRRAPPRSTALSKGAATAGGGSGAVLPRETMPPPAPAVVPVLSTPIRSSSAAQPQSAADVAPLRPPVCSPSKAGGRRTSVLSGGKQAPTTVPAVAADSAGAASDDDNANSENDTQIRLSAGPSAQLDPLVGPCR